MDILKKMFKADSEKEEGASTSSNSKDEFRKPQWFEETETDDELFDDDRKFAFQVFTNPLELQKHFERQMQQILEAVSAYENENGPIEKNLKEEFLKPGFEGRIIKEFSKQAKGFIDTDLDGEIYADQLHSLIQRLNPGRSTDIDTEIPVNILPPNKSMRQLIPKKKLTDEEVIMGKIHGTITDNDAGGHERQRSKPKTKPEIMTPMTPMMPRGSIPPFGGAFDGNYQGPKMFSQSVVSKTIRKPDGSYETTKITQDSAGNKVTTITRSVNGKTETITTYDGAGGQGTIKKTDEGNEANDRMTVNSDRNIYVTKEGYAMPRNLW